MNVLYLTGAYPAIKSNSLAIAQAGNEVLIDIENGSKRWASIYLDEESVVKLSDWLNRMLEERARG